MQDPIIIFAAGLIAGAVNALAGGGTIVSYPALVALGIPPLSANATSMVALWPGTVGGSWGFKKEIRASSIGWRWMILPSLVGGLSGAFLLVELPGAVFEALAHWFVLGASILIAIEPLVRRKAIPVTEARRVSVATAAVMITIIGIYGGYFGAGIGILLLPVLGFAGSRGIHTSNGLKNLFMLGNKGVAALYLALGGLVDWGSALPMAVGAILGAWGAASLGRKVPDRLMRISIMVLGIGIFFWLVLGNRPAN